MVPPKGQATAKIAVLVSTYTVYANHARPEWVNDPAWRAALVAQNQAWGAYPHNQIGRASCRERVCNGV